MDGIVGSMKGTLTSGKGLGVVLAVLAVLVALAYFGHTPGTIAEDIRDKVGG